MIGEAIVILGFIFLFAILGVVVYAHIIEKNRSIYEDTVQLKNNESVNYEKIYTLQKPRDGSVIVKKLECLSGFGFPPPLGFSSEKSGDQKILRLRTGRVKGKFLTGKFDGSEYVYEFPTGCWFSCPMSSVSSFGPGNFKARLFYSSSSGHQYFDFEDELKSIYSYKDIILLIKEKIDKFEELAKKEFNFEILNLFKSWEKDGVFLHYDSGQINIDNNFELAVSEYHNYTVDPLFWVRRSCKNYNLDILPDFSKNISLIKKRLKENFDGVKQCLNGDFLLDTSIVFDVNACDNASYTNNIAALKEKPVKYWMQDFNGKDTLDLIEFFKKIDLHSVPRVVRDWRCSDPHAISVYIGDKYIGSVKNSQNWILSSLLEYGQDLLVKNIAISEHDNCVKVRILMPYENKIKKEGICHKIFDNCGIFKITASDEDIWTGVDQDGRLVIQDKRLHMNKFPRYNSRVVVIFESDSSFEVEFVKSDEWGRSGYKHYKNLENGELIKKECLRLYDLNYNEIVHCFAEILFDIVGVGKTAPDPLIAPLGKPISVDSIDHLDFCYNEDSGWNDSDISCSLTRHPLNFDFLVFEYGLFTDVARVKEEGNLEFRIYAEMEAYDNFESVRCSFWPDFKSLPRDFRTWCGIKK
ncbi:hypothetical protein QC823_07570 [Halomonas vilamensis]|uniref:Uncharacterized protein n=1 Tax=Vreelandella vilamensis TaxID=531309 RepID=A0ABU1H3H0_9GAMM|nr:hypothetical protein [Halomonas vilamensis]MDR5898845.1 hypothetical protein [Halomonas vilamensis]